MQTIDRAFSVLRALAGNDATSSLADVTRAAELPKSTVLRLLAALEDQGAVQNIKGRYAIGPGMAALSHHGPPVGALREIARPHLVELADQLQENVALTIADGDATLYLDTAITESSVRVHDWTGERHPYHATAGGLALLSTWSTARVDQLVAQGLPSFTASTVTNRADLDAKLDGLASSGVVWTLQEFSDDVNGIGAVVRSADGAAVGAVNAYGPNYRFPGDRTRAEIATAVLATCERIGERLV